MLEMPEHMIRILDLACLMSKALRLRVKIVRQTPSASLLCLVKTHGNQSISSGKLNEKNQLLICAKYVIIANRMTVATTRTFRFRYNTPCDGHI
jgi:hypothetical protein